MLNDETTGARLFFKTPEMEMHRRTQEDGMVTDAAFKAARGEEAPQGKEDLDLSPPPDDEPPAPETEDEETGEEAEGETGEEEPQEKEFSLDDLEITYEDPDMRVIPERDHELVRGLIQGLRGKDREATIKALKDYDEKLAPTRQFHEKFGQWEYPLSILSEDNALQEKVASVIEAHMRGEKGETAPEKPDGGGKTETQAAAPAAQADLSKIEIRLSEADRKRLEEKASKLEVDPEVAGYIDDLMTSTVKAGLDALAQNMVAQFGGKLKDFEGIVKTNVKPLHDRVMELSNGVLDRSIRDQEAQLMREHGDQARRFLKRDPKTKRHAVDEERRRAYAEGGEVLSVRTAFNNLLAANQKKPRPGALSDGKQGVTALRGAGASRTTRAQQAAGGEKAEDSFPERVKTAAQMKDHLALIGKGPR